MRSVIALFLLCVTCCGATCPALASCESGKPISYDDINAVMSYHIGGCGDQWSWRKPNPAIRCSSYWLFFWADADTTYSQQSRGRPDVGTWHLDASLEQAIAILKKDNFYEMSPGEESVTDMASNHLYVRRCGVVTILDKFPSPAPADPLVARLFADFDALAVTSNKTQIDKKPQFFEEWGLFGR